MRNVYRTLATVTVISLGAAALTGSRADSLPEPQIRHIRLTGQGEADLPTDMAIVNLGLFIRDRSHAQAQGEADRRMRRLVSSLGRLGVRREQIRNGNLTVGASYTKGRGSTEFSDYCDLRSDLSVVVYDMAKLAEIIEDSLKAGINTVTSVKLHCSRESEIETQAAQLALLDAKRKALALTKQMGNRLGRVQNVVVKSTVIEPSLNTPNPPQQTLKDQVFLLEPLKMKVIVEVTFALED